MKFLKSLTWEEVFKTWQKQEGSDPEWIKIAKEKGFSDWESWRRDAAKKIQASEQKWELYEIENPLEIVPKFIVGPWPSWQAHLPENLKGKGTFEDLVRIHSNPSLIAKNPELKPQNFSENTKIQQLMANFPDFLDSQMIGLKLPNGKIICYEGHHRAMALTLLKQKLPLASSQKSAIIRLAIFRVRSLAFVFKVRKSVNCF